MKRLHKFTEWLSLREAGIAGPQLKMTPALQTAQDMTTQALQKTPLKPGEKIADVLNDPKRQSDVLGQANKLAAQKGKPLNVAAAANAMDAAKAEVPAPGM